MKHTLGSTPLPRSPHSRVREPPARPRVDLLPTVVERIFGAGMSERIETWSGEIHPRCQPQPSSGAMKRAWVWLPGETQPRLYPIDPSGIIWLYDCERYAPK